MANTLTPDSFNSPARVSLKRIRAALLDTYADIYGIARVPAPLATLTIRPRPAATIPGTISRQHRKGPRILVSNARHQSAGSASQVGPKGPPAPALLISRAIGPSLSRAS